MEIFGYEFKRKQVDEKIPSFSPQQQDDGALVVAAGSSYNTAIDLDGSVRTEAELVTKYRDMSFQPECDSAVDEIINESFDIDEEVIVDINLDNLAISHTMKKTMRDEFRNVLKLLDFNRHAYDIYRRWYIDGRLYYHVMVDHKNLTDGIKEVRYIDPRKIRKIREVTSRVVPNSGQINPADGIITKTVNEYFLFNDKGFGGGKNNSATTNGLKVAKDAMIHVVSGLTDNQGTLVLSYLHKAQRALNQLRTLEDALVIYRLSRAPERRIWYIDVGNLPKVKAEQYLRDMMVKHKNRLVYNNATGEVSDDRKFMSLMEDYWLPRKEGGRGTEVTTLPGGQTLGQMDDVLYFQKKFLNCLNVPISRLNSDSLFSVGRATEITRDELKFGRYVTRLRAKFSLIFTKLLEKQLILKEVFTVEDWNDIVQDIKYTYSRDNYTSELKDAEMTAARSDLARSLQDMAGKYYSHSWIRKQILRQSDDDIELMDKQIEEENNSDDPRWINVQVEQQIQMTQQSELENQQMQADVHATHTQTDKGVDDHLTSKKEEVRQAQTVLNHLRKKKGNRSPEEQEKYLSSTQIIARNKPMLAQLGISLQKPKLQKNDSRQDNKPKE